MRWGAWDEPELSWSLFSSSLCPDISHFCLVAKADALQSVWAYRASVSKTSGLFSWTRVAIFANATREASSLWTPPVFSQPLPLHSWRHAGWRFLPWLSTIQLRSVWQSQQPNKFDPSCMGILHTCRSVKIPSLLTALLLQLVWCCLYISIVTNDFLKRLSLCTLGSCISAYLLNYWHLSYHLSRQHPAHV